jgi:CRISPR system Cascade subunit CasA
MNISTDSWIPVVWQNGQPDVVSLVDVFTRGHEIQDLTVRPHERIALMRLLICITQSALDGPTDHDDWKDCQMCIKSSVLEYLKKWHDAFELFGKGQRFLQVIKLSSNVNKSISHLDEGSSMSKLDVALATGNNSTLFDNAGGSERLFKPARLALNMLSFQCFSPGGRIGIAKWNGRETAGKGSSNHAPCITQGMLHALIRGKTLLETMHQNLMTKQQSELFFGKNCWGKPVWEKMPKDLTDNLAVQNATKTYLGRLVPLARAIYLEDNGNRLTLANGLDYISYPGWREPTATVVTRKIKNQPTRMILRASTDRAIWRELHALAVKSVNQELGGPAALQNCNDEKAFDLWVGGLVANQAKLVDTTESVFHIPAMMLTNPSQQAYEQGVRYAETTGFQLAQAVSIFHRELGDDLNASESRDRRQQIQNKAYSQYWTGIEQNVAELLEVATSPERLGLEMTWQKTTWGASVWRAARAAYEYSCAHVTPRQIRAYALGLSRLAATSTQS